MRNLTKKSATLEGIAHIDRNANIRKSEDRSYTRNVEPTPNPRYNRSNYSTRYNRYKNNETNTRYRNDTYLKDNKKTLMANTKSFEKDDITQDNKPIQIQVKKTVIKFTSQRS